MPERKVDRRVLRTRHQLQGALVALMVERGYEGVTVQDILDQAGVGRSTFYAHFRDKEELLRSSIDNLHAGIVRHWQEILRTQDLPMGELAFVLPFLQHLNGNRPLYRAIVGRESGMIVDRQFRRILGDMIRTDLAARPHPIAGPEAELVIQHIVGALMSLITWWMDHEIQLSPEHLNRAFLDLTLGGLSERLEITG